MKKTNLKKQIVTIVLLMLISIVLPQISKAAVLQANPTTNSSPTETKPTNWVNNVRTMETTGQAMGLTETVASKTALGTTESNGIDVHMMKNTEYGAMAILSASGFGNPANTKTIDTTTGNKTGVYMQTEAKEWAASRANQGGVDRTFAQRYFNVYETRSSSDSTPKSMKPGDALNLKWHEATTSYSVYGYYRGGTLGVFGFGSSYSSNGIGTAASRAVVVSGSGF